MWKIEAVLNAGDIISPQLMELLQFLVVETDQHPSTISLSFQTMVSSRYTNNFIVISYPLLFPFGHLGWQMRMPGNRAPNSRANITLREHYLIHISIRDQYSAIHRGRGLFQQILVDAYCKVESNNLNFYRTHQKELRRESYTGLIDYINNPPQNHNIRQDLPVILPSSFKGFPRAMMQNYQDAMAIVATLSFLSLLLAIHFGPKLQTIFFRIKYRPDLVCRVFRLKLKAILHDICKNCFGQSNRSHSRH